MAITKRGNTWQYTLNLGVIDGKRKRISKGGFKTKKECEIALAELKNKYNKTKQIKKVSDINFADFIRLYFNEYVVNNCKPKTQQTYSDYIKVQILPYFENYKLKDIDSSTIYNFIISLSKKYAKSTCDNIRGFLNSAFKFAIFPKEFIFENPMQNINFKNISYPIIKDKVILTRENMTDILNYLEKYPHYKFVIEIMYYTGMRISEVCGLEWEHIDFENRMIYVRQQLQRITGKGYQMITPKSKSSIRDISMNNALYDILLKKKKEYDLSTATHNHVCTAKDINKIFVKDYIGRVSKMINRDVCPFHSHAIRHLHATMLIENGASIKDVSARLGHSSTDISYNIYVELSKKQKDKTVEILNEIF